ncbi:MAG: pyruvate carboxyltransferase [Chloroflexi bacterium]|nr:pyruvate carboxyltransferase [Chloroflexota bacterium]
MSASPAHHGVERFRESFPYDTLPRALFEPRGVPMAPAPERWITDTTFRDGQQARTPYTAEQVLHIFDLLHQLDNNTGVVRKSEFFVYTDLERAIVERCRARGYQYPEVTAWIRAKAEDLAIVRDLGLAETGLLTSVSDHHIFAKLGLDHKRAMENYLQVVDAALSAGVRPRCHFEDVTRADIHGFVVPFARALMERGQSSGTAITIRLCDTMGVGLPWAEAALPRGVPRLVHTLVNEAGVPPAQLEWHGHNDFFKGHACAATAWLYGCAAINSTLLGTGERAGNTPLEAAVIEHIGLTGESRLNLPTLVEIAEYLQRDCGVPLPANYPILGDECFTTRAGVHIDGLLKDPETYMSFDPQHVLGRPIGVVVSDKSGAAGVAWWVNEHYHLAGEHRIAKSHAGIQAIYRDIAASYEAGRTADPSTAELRELAKRHLPGLTANSA